MPTDPSAPVTGPRYALEGKIVTMDGAWTILERGLIYIDEGKIAAVLPTDAPSPPGFDGCPQVNTGGTIYPGLIELHNHLSYNILPLWHVPKRFGNRGQWGSHPDYRKLVSGPMSVLGRTAGYVEAIVRYVECKCLLGGVTTSQGIALFSNSGIQRYYRGITRNVEETGMLTLPDARTKISDVEARDADKFLERLQQSSCLLLHLSEGVDERAREHFEALHLPDGRWAITPALAGIHSAGLVPEDFGILKQHGAAMIWSPLSNLLLYGATARIGAAKEAGVLIGLGSDWSPSGSKNLLGELKVARLVSQEEGDVFSDREIVAMATINAAKILKWDHALGSIEAGKYADLLVVHGRQGDPYDRLLGSRESSITLVVVNGVPRYGQTQLMQRFGDGTEDLLVGSAKRRLNLEEATADPVVGQLTLKQARACLRDGLLRLAELAQMLEAGGVDALAAAAVDDAAQPTWFLELDHSDETEGTQRPHLPLGAGGEPTGLLEEPPLAGVPLSELLRPVELDELTVVDDPYFLRRLAGQLNLPAYVKLGLPPLYGMKPVPPESADFLQKIDPAVRPQFVDMTDLATFMKTVGHLSLSDRRRIVEQALVMLEQLYVHLPLKRAMHAVDPVQRLKLLQYHLGQLNEEALSPEIDFHNEMTRIFTSLRDLHTSYLLPSPFKQKTAFLPFLVEEYYEEDEPHYLVSKVFGDAGPPEFQPGVEILYWNGVPIRRAVALNAERQAGGNQAARFARGLDSLTIRPMLRLLPPDEEWVTIRYRTAGGEELEFTQKWLVFTPEPGASGIIPDSGALETAFLAIDLQADAIHLAKKALFAPQAVAAEAQREMAERTGAAEEPHGLETTFPTVFRAKAVQTAHGTFGYIRIFTFNVNDADAFVDEFMRLAGLLPQNGLIIDVRANGGGLIYAAERLLQLLTPRPIEPARAQFINTPVTLDICCRHAPSPLFADFNLKPWVSSIAQAVETGATYSLGFPITSAGTCNAIGQTYYGPVVLIVDPLCYSATDIFAAGFQDHQIGTVLGTSGNTGAGGANVWTHRLLQTLLGDALPSPGPAGNSLIKALPHGANMSVAIRRTLRTGERAGVPVEDLGVVPDDIHKMTKADLLEGNRDLIEKAGEILAGRPAYAVSINIEPASGNVLTATVSTRNISRLDVFFGGRPQQSLDVSDGETSLHLLLPPGGEADERVLELRGFAGTRLVAVRRCSLQAPL